MTAPTYVDRGAPVIAVHEIDIEAPLNTVCGRHTDVNGWRGRLPDITAGHIDGDAEPGVSVDWTSYGLGVVWVLDAPEEQ
jgi:hypothetical protein